MFLGKGLFRYKCSWSLILNLYRKTTQPPRRFKLGEVRDDGRHTGTREWNGKTRKQRNRHFIYTTIMGYQYIYLLCTFGESCHELCIYNPIRINEPYYLLCVFVSFLVLVILWRGNCTWYVKISYIKSKIQNML